MKKIKVNKTTDYGWYVILTDMGILQADIQGELWLGGGRKIVKPAIFWSYDEAKKARDKFKRRFKFLKWTEIKTLRRID